MVYEMNDSHDSSAKSLGKTLVTCSAISKNFKMNYQYNKLDCNHYLGCIFISGATAQIFNEGNYFARVQDIIWSHCVSLSLFKIEDFLSVFSNRNNETRQKIH